MAPPAAVVVNQNLVQMIEYISQNLWLVWTIVAMLCLIIELASGDKSKTVYLPYEATNLLGSIGGIKDLFKAE